MAAEPSRFDAILNALSDLDWTWWPFSWLRPAKHERISWGRRGVITVVYGAVYLVPLLVVLTSRRRLARSFVPFVLVAAMAFFVKGGLTPRSLALRLMGPAP